MKKSLKIFISVFLIILISASICTPAFAEINLPEIESSVLEYAISNKINSILDSDKNGKTSSEEYNSIFTDEEMYLYISILDVAEELNSNKVGIDTIEKDLDELEARFYNTDSLFLAFITVISIIILFIITTNIILFVKCSKLKKLYQLTQKAEFAELYEIFKERTKVNKNDL